MLFLKNIGQNTPELIYFTLCPNHMWLSTTLLLINRLVPKKIKIYANEMISNILSWTRSKVFFISLMAKWMRPFRILELSVQLSFADRISQITLVIITRHGKKLGFDVQIEENVLQRGPKCQAIRSVGLVLIEFCYPLWFL